MLPGGVNPLWSLEVGHRAMVEHAVEGARPEGLRTMVAGPVQASGSMWPSLGNAAGPMALGPVQASTAMVAGPGQTHGEPCPGWVHVQALERRLGLMLEYMFEPRRSVK